MVQILRFTIYFWPLFFLCNISSQYFSILAWACNLCHNDCHDDVIFHTTTFCVWLFLFVYFILLLKTGKIQIWWAVSSYFITVLCIFAFNLKLKVYNKQVIDFVWWNIADLGFCVDLDLASSVQSCAKTSVSNISPYKVNYL